MTSSVRKLTVHAAALLVAAVVLTFSSAVLAADDLSPDTRAAVTEVLRKRISDLLAEKDAEGIAYKRGSYSENFKKVDDATVLVSFHQDSIEKGPDGKTSQMKVERFTLTVKRDGSRWSVADQKLEDTWVGLYRAWFGGEEVYRFDSLRFEAEGLTVTSGPGHLYTRNARGKRWGARIVADNLAFKFVPPAGVEPWYALKRNELLRKNAQDIDFTPERIDMYCDPATCEEVLGGKFTGLRQVGGSAAGSGQASGSGGKFAKVLDEALRESEKDRRENPFSGFFREPRPDRRNWTFVMKREGAKEHYFSVDWDTYEPWQVRAYASGYFGALFAYYDEATRNAAADPYTLERREEVEAQEYEVVKLSGSVNLAVEEPETLNGDIAYTLRAKKEVKELPIFIPVKDFDVDDKQAAKRPTLLMNSIRDGEGNELTWVRVNPFQGLLILPKPLEAGKTIDLAIQFKSTGSIYKVNPSFSAVSRGGWLPLVRFGDMIDTFALTIRTPAKYDVIGIGKKASEAIEGNVRVTKWVANNPVSFASITFGDYLSDVSKHAATKDDGTPIPVRVYADKVSASSFVGTEGSDSGARDIRGKQLAAIGTQASVAMDIYKRVFGIDYPFDKLDLVADPMGSFYGQAPSSVIYLGFGVFRGEGTVASFGGSDISKFNKDVVAHEVGHQWWGSRVTNSNDRNYWFVESLAELSSALYVEEVFGRKRYLDKVADWRKNVLDAKPWASVQNGYTVWAGEGPTPIANIYNKGPYAFHILRSTFGDDKFFAFLKELGRGLNGKEIVTRDIQAVMERVYQGNMDWFFDQWIRGVGMPQYAVFYTIRPTEDGKWLVQGKIRQRVVAGENNTEMPGVFFRAVAPMTFVAPDGKKFRSSSKVLVQGPETPFQFKLPQEAVEVVFNDEGEILAQDVLYNQSW